MSLYEQTGVIVRPTSSKDRYGTERDQWGAAAERIPIEQINVQPAGGSSEDNADRHVVVTGWLLISAPGTMPDLRDTDRLEVDGLVLEVTGKVGRWPTPVGMRHIEAQLKEVS
ncbi:hypothetical protein AB0F46_21525 [Streptomyces sp. NPDC026665]|uniref:hypothetical protein n=1 Tax=Streptomyces sp. NPDC026665 TaxID=3154798 RepID=UPI003403B0AE